MRVLAGVALVLATAGSASAQTYVGAAFFGDIVRVSGTTYGNGGSGNGETFGGALRAGLSLGQQWGVELEFARSGELDATPDYQILASSGSFIFSDVSGSSLSAQTQIFPSPRISSERQLSTLSTLLWWNHELNERVSLVYLGGVAFTRAELDFRVTYDDFPIPIPIPDRGVPLPLPRVPRSIESKSVSYDADVAVGFEGRIGMTEHVRLTPGIRMQTAVGGWAIRPAVGVQWVF